MPLYTGESDPSNCPICGSELHSVNTKRLGNGAICSDCFTKLVGVWYDWGDILVTAAVSKGIEYALKYERPF